MLTAMAGTFLYTWLFNSTGGSLLLVMLLHAASNAASGLMNRLVPAALALVEPLRTLVDDGWLNVIAFGLAVNCASKWRGFCTCDGGIGR